MYLIQVMLRRGLRHKLPYAFVKTALNYQIWASAKGRANTFVFERRPFSENRRSIKFDLNVGRSHSYRFAFFFFPKSLSSVAFSHHRQIPGLLFRLAKSRRGSRDEGCRDPLRNTR